MEVLIAIALLVMFAICALLLCYDISIHKTQAKLDAERASVRKMKTRVCEKDALLAMEGK